jgi:diguanylate cyclase (GGDEF)-like protein
MQKVSRTRSWRCVVPALALGLVAAACGGGGVAHADPGPRWQALRDLDFTTIGTDQDLILHEPNALAEDGEGYLWAGTANGLVRWDGYRARTYVAHPGGPNALQDDFVKCLHTDPHGVLWIGTSAGGLARYDRARDRFTSFGAGPNGLSHVSVRAIADDGNGGLWVGTDGGLDHLDPATGTVERMLVNWGTEGIVAPEPVLALLHDRAGALWIGTPRRLLRWPAGEMHSKEMLTSPGGDADGGFDALYEDSAGRIWAGTQSSGAYALEPGQSQFRPIGQPDAAQSGPIQGNTGTDWITQIVEAAPGEIWLGTYDQGIRVVDTASWTVTRVRHDPLQPNGLPHDNIRALHRDRSGLVWVGTNGGLGRYNAGNGFATTVNGQTSRRAGIIDPEIFSVFPAPDGHIWLGLRSSGVDILDPAGGRVAAIRAEAGGSDTALPHARVWAITAASGGDIYLGTEKGLYRTDLAGHLVARVPVAADNPALRVTALLSAGKNLWIGSAADGLWQYDPATRQTLRNLTETALSDRRVESLAADGESTLWVGTDHGLNRLDIATGAAERILPDPKRDDALSAGFITALLTDRQGRLWVGTLAGGIDVLEGRDADGRPRFRHIGTDAGLPHANVDALLLGPDGRIWASTDDGIGVIDPATFAVQALGRADGIAIPEYLGGSGAVTPQGEVLFGGVGGLTVLRPDRLAPWHYAPPIVATQIRAGETPLPPDSLGTGDGNEAELTIEPSADRLMVGFSALDYSAPERNRYAYKLEGFDSDWIAADAQNRHATYTNLPPGHYVLRIRGSNRDGIWSEQILALPVRVLPAWYQTLWFRFGAALVALVAVTVTIQSRTAYLRRRQAVLETEVADRTLALSQRTDELEAAKRELEVIAFVDVLTSLPNRRMFSEQLHKQMAQAARRREGFALLLLDLDRFKQTNDTLGHDAGDVLLQEAARRFQSAVREADFVARLGGDEFAILLVGAPEIAAIELVCRRIVESFVEPVPFAGHDMRTSPSIGIALYPDHGDNQETLFKSADLALYAAKHAGRNTWRWYGAADAVAT